jgi:hypothetical protein
MTGMAKSMTTISGARIARLLESPQHHYWPRRILASPAASPPTGAAAAEWWDHRRRLLATLWPAGTIQHTPGQVTVLIPGAARPIASRGLSTYMDGDTLIFST